MFHCFTSFTRPYDEFFFSFPNHLIKWPFPLFELLCSKRFYLIDFWWSKSNGCQKLRDLKTISEFFVVLYFIKLCRKINGRAIILLQTWIPSLHVYKQSKRSYIVQNFVIDNGRSLQHPHFHHSCEGSRFHPRNIFPHIFFYKCQLLVADRGGLSERGISNQHRTSLLSS